MKTVILAGGKGTRLRPKTEVKPKPMVEVGGKPILWHIMKIYAHHGYDEFLVALGYKGNVIKEYFRNFYEMNNDLSVDLSKGHTNVHDGDHPEWTVHCVDTGFETMTGGRVKRLRDWIGDDTFMLTYGDGVADVDIQDLVDFHHNHDGLATVTSVRPPARFGGIEFDGDQVTEFEEKPQTRQGWINGGFFVLEPEVADFIPGDKTPWEHTPLETLADEGELYAYRHRGFWQAMDTLRDVQRLDTLWEENSSPWKVWG